ncbi:prion protein b [Dunckerocampus dactyliophorus]|uniref:prion protein b n=1 Tax=Dunckerocampus dactyliophorus TaxID=161453 RepID=UPI0024064BD5|nr:prion protein b [Dunckerocampus dactyliophorus]
MRVKMKWSSFAVLCLTLFYHLSLAKRGGGGFGKGFGFKKPSTSNRGRTHTNTGNKNNQGSSSQGLSPKHPTQNNQGGYNQHPGRPGSYPQQPSGGGYHNQYPAHGGGYGSYGGHGFGAGNGRYGGYPSGYINHNPNNPILNPRYGSNFGYQGQGFGGGSPFSRSVQAMNVMPNDKSRGFGHSAAMAAAGGAMAGMALGYGLGTFPRPHFHFRNPTEEYYYNHYMHRKYNMKSTDANDYGRDFRNRPPPKSYDDFMGSCMKRTDILPPATNQNNKLTATTAAMLVTSSPDTDVRETNNTSSSNSSALAPLSPNQPQADLVSPSPKTVSSEIYDDTVSIVEIGYPALIEQVKARRCLERYMLYSENYTTGQTGGTSGLEMSMSKLLIVLTSALVVLLNSTTGIHLH